ncbi:GNAT family N-acetyltransferase [Archangium violaceum]|uniref:GNAT family N-acetyltransferase n=1 Tax=Archangium violaceum TaxID=83451 RepID=UPI0019507D93|nr:GNAT family N-acetyltransferase [Archangium violaceum]QRN98188.1 GNAT family N-acetyltransferase [Archangium violaceum]
MTAVSFSHLDPRVLALRIENAQAEQVDRTPFPSRQGVPSLRVAGGRAIYLGPRSPYSVAIGVGLEGLVGTEDLERIESHLGAGGGTVRIELNPFCEPSFSVKLAARGYRVERFLQVWWRSPSPVPPPVPGVEVRPVRPGEERLWSELFFLCFVGRPTSSEVELAGGLGIARTEGNTCFLALQEGEPRGVGVVSATGGVALLSADGVVPAFRGRRLQLALIHARMAWAAERGCDVVTASTEPQTASQRNYERAGFRCAYPKLVMMRQLSPWGWG